MAGTEYDWSRPAWPCYALLSLPPPVPHVQEQALRKAAELQQQAAKSAKEGLAGARMVASDIARGDAKSAGGRVGGWAQRASASAGMLYVARLLVRAGVGAEASANACWDTQACGQAQ